MSKTLRLILKSRRVFCIVPREHSVAALNSTPESGHKNALALHSERGDARRSVHTNSMADMPSMIPLTRRRTHPSVPSPSRATAIPSSASSGANPMAGPPAPLSPEPSLEPISESTQAPLPPTRSWPKRFDSCAPISTAVSPPSTCLWTWARSPQLRDGSSPLSMTQSNSAPPSPTANSPSAAEAESTPGESAASWG